MSDYRKQKVVIRDAKPRNRVKCLKCGAVLESLSRHDFQMCSCENQTFTDGGTDYQRIGAIDLSWVHVMEDDEDV